MDNSILRSAIILGGFALATTFLIGLTYFFTAPHIADAKQAQLMSTLNKLVPAKMHSNELYKDCVLLAPDPLLGNTEKTLRVFRARKNDEDTALIIETTTPNGYSGDIDLVMAINKAHEVLGARVIAHKETPGLGDKIDLRVDNWILQFNQVALDQSNLQAWQVKKDGGKFDQFTGATITPRAVVEAVKNAGLYAIRNEQFLYTATSDCMVTNND